MIHLGAELHRYFRGRIRDTGEAEDMVNNTWLAAGRTFQGHCTLRVYLFSIAKRMMYEYWRRRGRRPWYHEQTDDPDVVLDDDPDLDIQPSNHVDILRLHRAVASLPAPFREPVEMALHGYGFVEMAQVMDVNYNTVRSRFIRGRDRLKKMLEAELESDADLDDAEPAKD